MNAGELEKACDKTRQDRLLQRKGIRMEFIRNYQKP